jgi:hypothetical protein
MTQADDARSSARLSSLAAGGDGRRSWRLVAAARAGDASDKPIMHHSDGAPVIFVAFWWIVVFYWVFVVSCHVEAGASCDAFCCFA